MGLIRNKFDFNGANFCFRKANSFQNYGGRAKLILESNHLLVHIFLDGVIKFKTLITTAKIYAAAFF